MRLTQLLTLTDGVHEQGRPVKFTMRYKGPDGLPAQRPVQAVMLPVSEPEIAKITEAAAGNSLEFVLLSMRACLRDPKDLRAPLIETAEDLQALRDGLVGPQYRWLGEQYQELLRSEYPDIVTAPAVAELKKDADGFSSGVQAAQP
jgi:hypothetical protein